MSLVGNLEDLSLGDILQIISLSQKSGVLALAGDQGSGRIVFRQGMVQAACLKDSPNDLRELLLRGRVIDPAGFDACLARARDQDVPIEEILESEADLNAERIEKLIREATEAAILEMFTWPAGDFSFDVRSELDPEDPQLILPNGINAQYLAMEGLRLRDEQSRDAVSEEAPFAATDPAAGEFESAAIFGTDPLETDTNPGLYDSPVTLEEPLLESIPVEEEPLELELLHEVEPVEPELECVAVIEGEPVQEAQHEGEGARDTLVARILERADAADLTNAIEDVFGVEPEAENPAIEPLSAISEEPLPTVSEETSVPDAPLLDADGAVATRGPSSKKMPVVLIDPDVIVLEWVKAAIEEDFARVHVFQQADQGLARIRQYLIRGETPLVLISPEAQIDPLSGIHGLTDFIKRLKAQAPRLVVLGLREDDDAAPLAMPGTLNGVLRRPGRAQLVERNEADEALARQVLSCALLEILAQQAAGAPTKSLPTASFQVLRDATAKLNEASSKGEILPVVLDFAAEAFARVAILIVREDAVFAIAGRGLPSLEVDPLDSAPPISLSTLEPGWIRQVLDSGKPLVGAASTDADRALIASLGGGDPEEVYLGPIESGSTVIAMLYGDQATGTEPMPDTSGLEVVLQHAGLALDRAALERALLEADSDNH